MTETATWTPESEEKHEAYRRLLREGRWKNFSKLKAQVRREQKLSRDSAFRTALAEFPPEGEQPPEPKDLTPIERIVELRNLFTRMLVEHFEAETEVLQQIVCPECGMPLEEREDWEE